MPGLACGQAEDEPSRHLPFLVLVWVRVGEKGLSALSLLGLIWGRPLLSLPQQSHGPQSAPSVVPGWNAGLPGHRRHVVVAISPAQVLQNMT